MNRLHSRFRQNGPSLAQCQRTLLSNGPGISPHLALSLKPLKIFGGLVSICAGSDMDTCEKYAEGSFSYTMTDVPEVKVLGKVLVKARKILTDVAFKIDVGIKIPVLMTSGTAVGQLGSGKANLKLTTKLFGIFQSIVDVELTNAKFTLHIKRSLNLADAVKSVETKAKAGVKASFDALLSVTDEINKSRRCAVGHR